MREINGSKKGFLLCRVVTWQSRYKRFYRTWLDIPKKNGETLKKIMETRKIVSLSMVSMKILTFKRFYFLKNFGIHTQLKESDRRETSYLNVGYIYLSEYLFLISERCN